MNQRKMKKKNKTRRKMNQTKAVCARAASSIKIKEELRDSLV